MAFTIPSDANIIGNIGHTTDHNNICDILKLLATTTANVKNTAFAGGAKGDGGTDDTAAIQAALLSFGTLGSWSQGQGGTVYMPPGQYFTSKPLIIPSGVTLMGSGVRSSQIRIFTGSNCDIIQFATYNSSAQATILGVSAGSIMNAFYAGIEKLSLHGDSFGTTTAGYHHGINQTTASTGSTDPGDPDFDPQPTIRDMLIEACTGDGIFVNARGGTLIERVTSEYNNGNGFSIGFDTTMIDCLANSNTVCGFYQNHYSDVAAGCKSYLTANGATTWVSGGTYTAGTVVLYAPGPTMYFCILNVSGSSTVPGSDPTHWTALSATSPAAWGYGYYWDSNSGEQSWTGIDGQQNTAGDYYFNSCPGGVLVDGCSDEVNFPNSSNPNNYSSVTVNGGTGVHVTVTSTRQGTGLAHLWRTIGSPTNCSLIAVTDGTGGTLFSGNPPQFAMVNGKVYSNFDVTNVGQGLQVAEGSNAKQGIAVLVAGSKVVSNTSVTANSRILLTSNADGGTPGWLRVSARSPGTSFTITSSSGTDTSTVAYEIFEPG